VENAAYSPDSDAFAGELEMRKSMIAGVAFAIGAALATPMVAFSAANEEPQLAQAGPGMHGPGMPGMGGMMGGMMEDHDGMGRMGHRHGWMHRMMGMGQSPRERCEDRLARRAGMIAYVVARLNLTAEQKPLWDKLQNTLQTNADKERQLCTGLKTAEQRGQETLLDKVNRREQGLATRLQAIRDAKAPLEQLYQALTAEQKAIADHPFRR